MKQVDEMPTSGQFVAVWQCNKKPWSEVYEWDCDGDLYTYNETADEAYIVEDLQSLKEHHDACKVKYFIAD